ncbi:MAG: Rne/Rng family ribonuclease [bacterium]|nr:Rne/Rng family ribonuclease [Acidimicrobiia bacterium]MCY4650405.1 Rne/Rng family ribonuclease [bacterium]
MGWLKRRRTEVIRRVGGDFVEERKKRQVNGSEVEIRRVAPKHPPKPKTASKKKKTKARPSGSQKARSGVSTSRGSSSARSRSSSARSRGSRPDAGAEEPKAPIKTLRSKILVSVREETRVAIMEGPDLVEYYSERPEGRSLVGNVYLAVVRNVLPGMEAAFVDIGEGKNGVLYADDVYVDPKRFGKGRRPRVEQVLSEGDELVVQVRRDAMGAKGPRLRGHISLAGRFLVLQPGSSNVAISQKLSRAERSRLRQVVTELVPPKFGVIVRTAARLATAKEIKSEVDKLANRWKGITEDASQGGGPKLLHQDSDLLIRVIREHLSSETRRVEVDDAESHKRVVDYLRSADPDLVSRVRRYDNPIALFERFHVDDQVKKALKRRVPLPSGGHLVFDTTEALTVVDVNTGRFVGRSNLEDTILQNNLEAAEEIGRQLRLRDIGGIIVVDFIDMSREANQRKVLSRLKQVLARDKTRTEAFEVSRLGLVEMTRKNVSAGLLESFSKTCDHCSGQGLIVQDPTMSSQPRVAAGV